MGRIIASFWAMFTVLHALGMFVADLSFPKIPSGLDWRHGRIIASLWAMFAVLHALGMFAADLVKSR